MEEHTATSEAKFLNRRDILKGLGIGGLSMAISGGVSYRAFAAEEDPSAGLYPVPRNEAYTLERPITPESINTKYNNFYEFGSHKQIYSAAQALKIRPWEIQIDGEVDKPITIGIDDLLKKDASGRASLPSSLCRGLVYCGCPGRDFRCRTLLRWPNRHPMRNISGLKPLMILL